MMKFRYAVFVLFEIGLFFILVLWTCLIHSSTANLEYTAAAGAFSATIVIIDVIIALLAGNQAFGGLSTKEKVARLFTAVFVSFSFLLLSLSVMTTYFPGTFSTILELAGAWAVLIAVLAVAAVEFVRDESGSSASKKQECTQNNSQDSRCERKD